MLFKTIHTLGLVAVAAAGIELTSGLASRDPIRTSDGIAYGDPVVVGNGTVRSYITYTGGEAVEVGVAMSAGVMQGLPAATSGDHAEGHLDMHEFVLDLPAGNPTPFKHVGFNWNPGGHEPPGIYDLPHFDFHFYTIPLADRMAIVPSDSGFNAKAANYPAPAFIPAGYVAPAPMGIPQLGVHWIDPTSPELNGKAFTRTFIYGSWNGKVIFAEPMITKAFLESRPDVTTPIAVAQHYSPAGRYPTAYAVRWNERAAQYEVALTGLSAR